MSKFIGMVPAALELRCDEEHSQHQLRYLLQHTFNKIVYLF